MCWSLSGWRSPAAKRRQSGEPPSDSAGASGGGAALCELFPQRRLLNRVLYVCRRTRRGSEKRCPSLAAVLPSPQREEVSRSAIALTNSAKAFRWRISAVSRAEQKEKSTSDRNQTLEIAVTPGANTTRPKNRGRWHRQRIKRQKGKLPGMRQPVILACLASCRFPCRSNARFDDRPDRRESRASLAMRGVFR